MTGREPTRALTHTKREGISIRTLSVMIFIVAILAILFSLFESQRTTSHARSLYQLEQERQLCDSAIQQFMDGSDYLTDQVRAFVAKGERAYMDSYWTEVYETQSRDKALTAILGAHITPQEREAALQGKSESDALIQGEIRAMRMVSESIGIEEKDMPADVAKYALSAEDQALTNEQKLEAALKYVFGADYLTAKSTIRSHVTTFRGEIASRYAGEAIDALNRIKQTSIYMTGTFALFLLVFIGVVVCFMTQIVYPLLSLSNDLKRGSGNEATTLTARGALEIKLFAKAFNALSARTELNTKRLERMGYVDYLTDVPNRASVTEYVAKLIARDQHPLGLMIIDIDNFKRFNDTFGHALGDRVLKSVAQAVCSVQSPINGISGRLCGEEFIVVQQGANEDTLRDTAQRILNNVRRITGDDVNLPDTMGVLVTVSIGGMIWRGELPADFNKLLSRADKALYESKASGRTVIPSTKPIPRRRSA